MLKHFTEKNCAALIWCDAGADPPGFAPNCNSRRIGLMTPGDKVENPPLLCRPAQTSKDIQLTVLLLAQPTAILPLDPNGAIAPFLTKLVSSIKRALWRFSLRMPFASSATWVMSWSCDQGGRLTRSGHSSLLRHIPSVGQKSCSGIFPPHSHCHP